MKRFSALIAALVCAVAAFAQSPQEIIARMESEMDKHEKDGIIMTVDVTMPILGSISTQTYALGEKFRMEANMMGVQVITWSDGKTKWTYDSKKNQIVIENENPDNPTSSSSDTEMFSDITQGYDVTMTDETDKAWYFECRKSKSNKDKDAPKTINLAVAKGTYYPVSLSTKAKGVTLSLRNISFGVSENKVTFNPKDYPDATVVDKR